MNNTTFCTLFRIQGKDKVEIEAPIKIVQFVL